ncbi:MBL fold metallo-hydrolase [Streptomyces microflavus]|uniref:MBL fold metallo-hydrolase n=1 Tax=Streptomyces microflavus TaxID=1919 RepID=UPI003862DB26|nr:MBL fold metallo-hydrolase [Streptomyces microflavus]
MTHRTNVTGTGTGTGTVTVIGTGTVAVTGTGTGTVTVHRLDLGFFVRPAAEVGGPHPRVEPVLAYLVEHERGRLLFDTGIGAGDPGAEAHYRPRRRPLEGALAAAGAALEDVAVVVNCHLHFDHIGGNPLLAGVPVLVQEAELATARRGGYTIDALVDFPGARYEELSGEAELWPGVWIVPTPGHTDGHQSLVVRQGDGTVVVLAGQAHDFASHYASDELARRAALDGVAPPLPPYRPWLDRLADFEPGRVFFGHDCSVWEPVPGQVRPSQ